jgi:hypothetical protein
VRGRAALPPGRPGAGHVTLFSGPFEGDYERYVTVTFGGKLELPEPFAFALDTAD